ncbi:MAG: glycosyltransferase family 4 protein [Chloroflexi bacterium]|nr:glycosyltransferase family 4 protein [Chloroflexota bacterium]
MRIGLVTGEYPPMEGGIGAHCRELAREMTHQGHSVFVYSDSRSEEANSQVALTHNQGGWGIGALRSINRWASDNKLDIVNLHYQTAAFQMSPFVHWLPDAVKVPVITTFHDLRFPYLFPKAGRLRDWTVMRLARASEGVISTNHEDFARLKSHHCAALIPIGSSVKTDLPPDFDRSRWRDSLGASETDYVVAHFGFINHTKGVDTLLRAARTLLDQALPVRVWLVGGRTGTSDPTNEQFANAVQDLAVHLDLTDRVVWTGFLGDSEAAACFAACDAVALLYSDGASYRRSSLMAAIAQGAAILTTEPAVAIPAFRDGMNMRLISPADVQSAAGALSEMWLDPVLRSRLRVGARELAGEFTWPEIARSNVEHFSQIVAEARR